MSKRRRHTQCLAGKRRRGGQDNRPEDRSRDVHHVVVSLQKKYNLDSELILSDFEELLNTELVKLTQTWPHFGEEN